jgi:uncharacterized protein (TIGR03083 family)
MTSTTAAPAPLYATVRARIGERLRATGPAADTVMVPSCPAWTVAQLTAHLAGTTAALVAKDYPGAAGQAWVDGHVSARAGRSALENWAEWDAVSPAFEAMLTAREAAFGGILYDAIIHEDDINAALGEASVRDGDAIAWGLGRLFTTLDSDARAKGTGTLSATIAGQRFVAGEGDPAVGWACDDAWTALRALGSRRSATQLAALGLTGDLAPWIALLHSDLPVADLQER